MNNFLWKFCPPIISKSTHLLSPKFLALIFHRLIRPFPLFMKAASNMQWYNNYNSITQFRGQLELGQKIPTAKCIFVMLEHMYHVWFESILC